MEKLESNLIPQGDQADKSLILLALPGGLESGAWPLTSLRQSFLNGSLTRLLDPDRVQRGKILGFVQRGDFGLAPEIRPGGTYERVWYEEDIAPEEVAFESGVVLLKRSKAQTLKKAESAEEAEGTAPVGAVDRPVPPSTETESDFGGRTAPVPPAGEEQRTIHLTGNVPPEVWNRLGTKLLPKLRSGSDLRVGVEFSVTVDSAFARSLEVDLRQILEDLGLSGTVRLE
ncbi:MAG: hypothetical protein GWN84_22150 [Gammaproteobacteria bacterium]|nr:hypothetical protein [Gammaproteobacteria bacterium]NIR88871.1 hypothetical protein [Gammaproteobacteria bacterium]NIU06475.1 hypothetical protein [Gammaproteobacteria bacterium]NIV53367.1 hypothetical protein [Gammaproteobacteria bacterium]NIV74086.1 hypothetical protein [Gammaproteobacteria bacterium]